MVSEILNDEDTISMAYRQMCLPKLLTLIGRAKENLLLVGRHNCWLVNARTFHPRKYIGSHLATGMTRLANSDVTWQKLENFVKRYAAPNATVKVHCLHEHVSRSDCVAEFRKCKDAAFQLPGCGLANRNGIRLPAWIRMPLDSHDLGESALLDWPRAKADIQRALRPNRDVPGVGVEMADEPTVLLDSQDEDMDEPEDDSSYEPEADEDGRYGSDD